MTRVLIISGARIDTTLAGPSIRAIEMARYLAPHCQVTLAAPHQVVAAVRNVAFAPFQESDQAAVRHLAEQADIVVVQGWTLRLYPCIEASRKILVVDLYDPFHLERLETFSRPEVGDAVEAARSDIEIVNEQLEAGDFFICASERQRDFWLGALGSLGRLAPETYRQDPTFRTLVDVVPFGLAPEPPTHNHAVIKGVVPGIEASDRVVLWGGGLWDWLDPLTVIRAMQVVSRERPAVKLFFLGHHHPDPGAIPNIMYGQAIALATELGLRDSHVFFNDRWVPYDERGAYLLEADIGVSSHGGHIETRFAFRTRLLDYIWAGLPMVVTAGDTLADMVGERGLGYVTPVGDSLLFAQAIMALADQPDARTHYAPAFHAAQHDFAWPRALRPLIAFCRQPHYAADKQSRPEGGHAEAAAEPEPQALEHIAELEKLVAAKNNHIVRLETLIKRIEDGRMLRILRLLNRILSHPRIRHE